MKAFQFRSVISRNLPIKTNLCVIIAWFGVCLIVFLWGSLYFKIQDDRKDEMEEVRQNTSNYARILEEHTLRTLKAADQTLLFLKHEYERAGVSADILPYVREEYLTGQPFILIGIIDENGNLAIGSQMGSLLINFQDCESFQRYKTQDDGQLFISKPRFGLIPDRWSVQMTRRINKPDGTFGGVALVAVDPYYFTALYHQVDLGADSAVSLVGQDGIVRAREADKIAEVGRDISGSNFAVHIKEGNGTFFASDQLDGIKRIYSFRNLQEYPLTIVVGISEEEMFRDLNQRLVGYLWIAGIITVVILTFIFILLYVAYRQRRTAQALKEACDTLEMQVEERTQDLFAVNQELTAMNEELHHANQELQNEVADRAQIEEVLRLSRKELLQRNNELVTAMGEIEQAQQRLIQQEKLAGIGQLAAGVAHEINNPLGFVVGNVETLEEYFIVFHTVLAEYRKVVGALEEIADRSMREKIGTLLRRQEEQELDYIIGDLPDLFRDTLEGLDRMNKIVKGMRVFSRVEHNPVFEPYHLHEGLDSTLLVAHNEIKHVATVEKNLGSIPMIEAVSGEINQVLLNLIVNAAHAIKAKQSERAGVINIATWADADFIYCAIADSGIGIKPEHEHNLFNPFFTTKPVGQGTGMGLSISYDIVVNRHKGDIWVESVEGQGAKFIVKLPIKHTLSYDEQP